MKFFEKPNIHMKDLHSLLDDHVHSTAKHLSNIRSVERHKQKAKNKLRFIESEITDIIEFTNKTEHEQLEDMDKLNKKIKEMPYKKLLLLSILAPAPVTLGVIASHKIKNRMASKEIEELRSEYRSKLNKCEDYLNELYEAQTQLQSEITALRQEEQRYHQAKNENFKEIENIFLSINNNTSNINNPIIYSVGLFIIMNLTYNAFSAFFQSNDSYDQFSNIPKMQY